MDISDAGIRFIAEHEGLSLRIYNDQAGLPTIGYGHLLSRVELDVGVIYLQNGRQIVLSDGKISEFDALELLHDDARKRSAKVALLTMDIDLQQHQFDALLSLAFNIGTVAFERSTLLRHLQTGNFADVPDQFRVWNKVTRNGKKRVSKGLQSRREREISMWLGQTPAAVQPNEDKQVAEMLRGRKTYFTALVMILIGLAQVAGYAIPGFDPANAGQLITEGIGFMFMRMGIGR